MATINTRTIKPSGGDYTSLSNWESGRQGDLVNDDRVEIAECYAMDLGSVTLNGWTTDDTRYIYINVPQSERHNGSRSPSKARIAITDNYAYAVDIRAANVIINGLQVKNTGVQPQGIHIYSVGGFHQIHNTIVHDCNEAGGNGRGIFVETPLDNTNVYLNNVVVLNTSGRAFHAYVTTGTTHIYLDNCTFLNSAQQGYLGDGGSHLYTTGKNCYIGGSTNEDWFYDSWNGGPAPALTNCASEDGTLSTTQVAMSTSSGAYFTNVTPGSEDIHIGSSSALKNAGSNLNGDGSWKNPNGLIDIDGDLRSSSGSWDIGADGLLSAVASWIAPQDTSITHPPTTPVRLRFLVDSTGSSNNAQFQLEFKKSTDSVFQKVT